jgi:hypothetical protein
MRPYFHLSDGGLELDNSFRELPAYQFRESLIGQVLYKLVDSSRLVQLANRAVTVVSTGRRARRQGRQERTGAAGIEPGIDSGIYHPPTTPSWSRAWAVTERLILAMRDLVEENGGRMLIVSLSTGIQVHPDAALRQQFSEGLGISDLFYPDKRVGEFAKESAIPFLALAPAFRDHAERSGEMLHGFDNARPGFGHWNERGHALGGRLIAKQLCASLGEP